MVDLPAGNSVRSKVTSLAIAALCAALPQAAPAAAATVTTIYDFYQHAKDPALPFGNLTLFRGGLYGTTLTGGGPSKHQQSFGTIYEVLPKTGVEKTLFRFTANSTTGPLTELNGTFFGVTAFDGEFGWGTIYKFDTLTHATTVLYNFSQDDGTHSQQLTAVGTLLYGSSQFDHGGCPCQLFSFDPASNTKTNIHTQMPQEGVPPGLNLAASGNVLYDTAGSGGAHDEGSVFKFDLTTRTETTLYDFRKPGLIGPSPQDQVIVHGHDLFGTTKGANYKTNSLYRVDLTTGSAVSLYRFDPNNQQEVGSLAFHDGALYGVTYGQAAAGSVFKLDLASGDYSIVHAFADPAGGDSPSSDLVYFNGAFYGTTRYGGLYKHGTLFQLIP